MTKKARILIVDDDELLAFSIQSSLCKLPNCDVDIVSGGQEALRLFERQPFDVLITDYQMPGVNGVALATRIRQLYPQTSVIIITCYDENALREQTDRAFIQHILGKPVWPSEMCALVSNVLEGERARAN